MSNEKHTLDPSDEARRVPRDLKGEDVPGKEKAASDVEVVSLEIEEDFDLGGDPYNRTGSYCIITPRDED